MGIFQRSWRQYAPPWLVGPQAQNIGTFYEATGALLDSLAQRVLDGRRAAIPWAGPGVGPEEPLLIGGRRIECEEDALSYHSLDRGITLYTTEPVLSRRMRLAAFRQLHARRGTHFGEIEHLRPYFASAVAYPTIRIVFQTNEPTPSAVWYSVAPDGTRSIRRVTPSNWDWDGTPSKRCRFWCIIYLPPGYATDAATWGGPEVWDGGALWDGLPEAVFADLYQMIADWHSAHSFFAGLIVTQLQPSDDIPGFPGHHPFDPTDTYQIDAHGMTTLPIGNWGSPVYTSGAYLGFNTRPSWATFYRIDNG